MSKYDLTTIILAILFVVLSWPLAQVYLPLSLIPLVIAAAIVIFRIWKRPRQVKVTK